MINTFAHMHVNDGRATLAIRVDNDVMEVGVSFCSPKEQFSKANGRARATGRLNAKRGYYVSVKRQPEMKIKEQATELVGKLVHGVTVSNPLVRSELLAGWIIGNPGGHVPANRKKRVPHWARVIG